jgi:cobalamin biosynthetic protein CobC
LLEHGGRLRLAAARYGIPLADWLDLSTGINPNGWPVPAIPAATWTRLPEDEDGLTEAAYSYYGTPVLLPVAGSQAAIQALPSLRAPCRVAVIHPGYAEHAHAWRRAGHAVTPVAAEDLDDAVPQSDVLVLIHPNNPTGARFPLDPLLHWHAGLAARGGWLVVDEAFMDAIPGESLARFCPRPGLIVLRSLGKFFGLAGARVGFVLAEPALLDRLHARLGPWTVTAPSRWVATQALADFSWQQTARQRLARDGERLASLLARHGLAPHGGCALFQWVCTPHAAELHDRLARRGILTRRFDDPPSLRFGLPGSEAEWMRLDAALQALSEAKVCA